MPSTTNKGYEVQVTGSNTGAWGTVLNNQALEYLDLNLGGITSKTLSNVNVTLTAGESRTAILRLSGILTGAVVITTECIGFFFVENLTSGAFAVTVKNDQVATAATIPQGSRQTVLSDATNGCRIISSGFETGVKTVFYMSTAPIGWTRDATAALNNAAIRLVTTGGATTAGTVDFTTAFASQAVAGTVGDTAITVAQMPLHGHPLRVGLDSGGGTNSTGGVALENNSVADYAAFTGTLSNTPGEQLGGTGGGDTHTHTFAGTAINLAVKFCDFMVASKD